MAISDLRKAACALAVAAVSLALCGCATIFIPRAPDTPFSRSAEGALAPGVSYWSQTRSSPKRQIFHVVRIDLTRPGLQMFVAPPDRPDGSYRAATTSAFVARHGAVLGVNASYFVPFYRGSPAGDDYSPQPGQPVEPVGRVIISGRSLPQSAARDPRVNAMLCLYDLTVEIHPGQECRPSVIDALEAGPLLLRAGQAQPFLGAGLFYARRPHPRTSVGVSEDGRTAWLVVVDGRQGETSEGATLYELTEFFQSLGAHDAINLDGGGSTTLAVADGFGAPEVLNSPIHTGVPGRERPVATHLGLRTTPTPGS